jgi:hypothetical protein
MHSNRLKRCEVIKLLGAAAAVWPAAARAQPPIGRTGKMPRVGIILFSIVSLPFLITASGAGDFTFKEYSKASEIWKRGFVFGISRYMSVVAQPDEEAPYPVRTAFERCFAGATDTLLVQQVEAYAAANPARTNGPMVAVVMRALFDLCRSEIEKAKPPAAAPSHR